MSRTLAWLALSGAMAALPCHADRTDRDKPVQIEADRMTADEAKQVAVFDGHVVLTQGTFTLHAERLTVQQDKDGFQRGVAVGKPATFRQKRDGVDEWIDGAARRIEYDAKTERVELFDDARITRDKDEVRGNYIAYDTRSAVYRVQGTKGAETPPRNSRVIVIIQPKKREEAGGRGAAPETKATPIVEGERR